jgi:citrate synthase
VSTLIGSTEAAAILDVSKATLYAYVSRGRLNRTVAPDGRVSLFDRDEVEQLARRSRRASSRPRATIDVVVSSDVTVIDETSLRYRGHEVAALAADHSFEDVAELLWSESGEVVPSATSWPMLDRSDREALDQCAGLDVSPIGAMAVAAHVLAERHPDDSATEAARRSLLAMPGLLGSTRRTGPYALRLAGAWRRQPAPGLVAAVDAALVLLADHELATGTLVVRVVASVRTSPYVAFAAGLASMEGARFGAASEAVHRFIAECAEEEPRIVIDRWRAGRRRCPGFGHSVYRQVDPRFPVLLDLVRRIDPDVATLVEVIVAEAGRVVPHPPNIDLAVGALTFAGGLDPSLPVFAVARLAGWGAHFDEEVAERPLRYRGIATPAR